MLQHVARSFQEAPKRPQDASKMLPRGPKSPHRYHKNVHFVWEGWRFLSFPVACNMSPLGRRRIQPAERGPGGSLTETYRTQLGMPTNATPPTQNAHFYNEDEASWGVLGASWRPLGASLGPLGSL